MSLEFKTLQPEEFYRQHIEAGVRPDGRELQERRAMAVSAGNLKTADGSSIVKLGHTTVVCGVKAELAPPRPEEPDVGYLVPNISLPAMCSPYFKPGPPSIAAQAATQFLSRVLHTSGCVLPSDLVVCPNRLVWSLYIDLVCLDHSGNIWDCAVAAMVAALNTVTLPKVLLDPDSGSITVDPGIRTPLPLHSKPVSCTSAVFHHHESTQSRVLADPTWEEEQLAGAGLTVVCLQSGEVCHLRQPGGRPVSEECLQSCISAAKEQAKLVTSAITNLNK